jgi:hypothetical protein
VLPLPLPLLQNQIIQGQARLGTRMMFQPTSLSSRSHLSLKAAVAQRHAKSDRTVRQFATVENPEKALEERGKSIEMRIKGREVLKNKRDKCAPHLAPACNQTILAKIILILFV